MIFYYYFVFFFNARASLWLPLFPVSLQYLYYQRSKKYSEKCHIAFSVSKQIDIRWKIYVYKLAEKSVFCKKKL